MRAGRWREFPVMLENQQKCLSIISAGNSSFARFSHDRKGREEAYFCLDFLVLLYQDKRTKELVVSSREETNINNRSQF